jgi:NitT/TauT family transport system substrate-binding protein
LLYIGGGSLLIQSMVSGDVSFAYGLSPPSNFRAAKSGMHELVDVGQLNIIFPNTPLSTSESFIKSNRDTAMRFLRGFTQGLDRLRNDKEFSMKVLSKYTKVTDTETLNQLHQTYGVRYSGDRIPYVRAEGVDEILKRTPGKEARGARAGDFLDNSVLRELEQSGWFNTLGR